MSKTPRSGTTRSTSHGGTAGESISIDEEYDPVLAEILRSRLYNIANEMGTVMIQTSGNPVITESMDFSTFVADADGEIIGYSGYLMEHAAPARLAVEYIIENQDDVQPGDQYICNDPFRTGVAHQPDTGIVKPIFHEDELVAWCWAESHLLDIGGVAPGGFAPQAEETYAEAIRWPGVKIVEDGEIREDIQRTITTNVRIPIRVFNDIRALIAANNRCEERLTDTIAEFGLETFEHYLDVNKRLSEQALRKRIEELPDGTYRNTEYVEHDGHENELYEVDATLTVDGDELTIDFSGSDEQAPGFINAGIGATTGTAFTPIANQLAPEVPVTEGMFEPFEIEAPEGTITNPVEPAPTSSGHMETGLAVLAAVHNLIARVMRQSDSEFVREHACAPFHETFPAAIYFGMNQFGEPDVFLDMHGGGAGGGATAVHDGQDSGGASSTQINAGIPNIETNEADHPVLYLWRRLNRNSSGPGEYRGGQGIEYAWLLHGSEQGKETVTSATTQVPTEGLMGGYPPGTTVFETVQGSNVRAALDRNELPDDLADLGGEHGQLPAKDVGIPIDADTVFANRLGGGSGLGDPLERDLDRVASDLRDGYVSEAQAENTYGVVVSDGRVDEEQSRERRRAMRDERTSWGADRTLADEPASVSARTEFHRYVDVVEDAYLQCSECEEVFAPYGGPDDEEWLAYTATNDSPIEERYEELSLFVQEREEEPDVRLREHACPGCGVMLQVDVVVVE